MKTIKGEYSGNLRCKVEHETTGTVVLTDAHKDNTSSGFTPPELFAISFLTCVATMMGYEAEALKIDVSGMKMEVSFDMSKSMPRRISKIEAVLWVPGKIEEHQKELLMKVAKNCPIRHSMHPDIEESIQFHWQGE